MDFKKKEVDDITVLERKRERERAQAEVNDDLHFSTTLGAHIIIISNGFQHHLNCREKYLP